MPDDTPTAPPAGDDRRWVAPFTFAQTLALIVWQARMHPYTCPNDGRPLKPIKAGLWCSVPSGCDYLQTWAHPFDPDDLDAAWLDLTSGRDA